MTREELTEWIERNWTPERGCATNVRRKDTPSGNPTWLAVYPNHKWDVWLMRESRGEGPEYATCIQRIDPRTCKESEIKNLEITGFK